MVIFTAFYVRSNMLRSCDKKYAKRPVRVTCSIAFRCPVARGLGDQTSTLETLEEQEKKKVVSKKRKRKRREKERKRER